MNTKKGAKSERIKSCILKGRATISHYSNKIIAARVQTTKFLDLQKILEFIPKSNNSKFYESLYCTETAPISKSQKLLHNLFDEKNKSNESKRRRTK